MSRPLVGFIGLGNMGTPMAANLLRAGYRLLVCDKSATAVSSIVSAGAESASSPVELSTHPDIQAIITMLPSQAALNDVYLGRNGILSAGAQLRSSLLLDSSTASPTFAADMARHAAASMLHPDAVPCCLSLPQATSSSPPQAPAPASQCRKSDHLVRSSSPPSAATAATEPTTATIVTMVTTVATGAPTATIEAATTVVSSSMVAPSLTGRPYFIDTPVSGGVAGARAGTLTFMAGGEVAAVAAAQPLLLAMGQRVIHCGRPGAGQAAKLCNNLVLAICMGAVSEGMALGKGLGLDPQVLAGVFNSSSARCWSSDSYNPCPGVMANVPSSNAYQPGFQATLMVKDLTLAMQAGQERGALTPLGSSALELYQQVAQHQGGTPPLDFSAVYKVVYEAALDM